ncbi:MAG: hypothetical protein JWM27_4236 [Gemmatimonadetes bacterium]|nr:hypothetical protein [Gemmatimonadota bacterium]
MTQGPAFAVRKQTKSRFGEMQDAAGELMCLTVSKRGAHEGVRRLDGRGTAGQGRRRQSRITSPQLPPCTEFAAGVPVLTLEPRTVVRGFSKDPTM